MSKRRRGALISLSLLLLIAVVWLDHRFGLKPAPPQSPAQTRSKDVAKYHNKSFPVLKVIDGDTLDIDIPDKKFNSTRIRLLGIDTPETKDENFSVMYFGPEAAQFTTEQALGKNVVVLLDTTSPTRDKYNRLLAYLKLPNGKVLNEILISQGFAFADLRFKHTFYEKYSSLQKTAQKNKKGLWKNITPQQLPQWLKRMKPNLLDD